MQPQSDLVLQCAGCWIALEKTMRDNCVSLCILTPVALVPYAVRGVRRLTPLTGDAARFEDALAALLRRRTH